MKKAFIKRLIANQYTIVDLDTKTEMIAYAKGKLRFVRLDHDSSFNKQETRRTKKEHKVITLSPKVGDVVYYDDREDQILITEVLDRKNDLVRPDVANVDQVLLVFSIVKPDFSFHLLDKFLVIMNQQNLTPVIVVSKIDLAEPAVLDQLKTDLKYYEQQGYELHYINSKARIGFDVLTTIFTDKITVLAGQTGVGKSTLLNALMPELSLKTQEISKALGRGKHTTRHTELYEFNQGYIVDTPGFSKIDFQIFHADELKQLYPDFERVAAACKFGARCLHLNEPNCAVKEAVETGEIPQSRYDNYVSFIETIKNQKERY